MVSSNAFSNFTVNIALATSSFWVVWFRLDLCPILIDLRLHKIFFIENLTLDCFHVLASGDPILVRSIKVLTVHFMPPLLLILLLNGVLFNNAVVTLFISF